MGTFALVFGSVLFAVALPNELIPSGIAALGPVALVPVFWLTRVLGPWRAGLAGAVWIVLVIVLSQFWLATFHPLALPLVLVFQIPLYAGLFLLLSVLSRRLGALSPWAQAWLWTTFEYLRIQGFFADPYHSLASVFWNVPIAFQSADLVGTSGMTFLLAATSAIVASIQFPVPRKLIISGCVLAVLWGADLGYGTFRMATWPMGSPWTVTLVQPAQDPWKGGIDAYRTNWEALTALSRQGDRPPVDVVVWPETAFVPAIEYHKRYHDNPESLALVQDLESFLAQEPVPYLLGNDHREKSFDGRDLDYNAVLAYDHGWKGLYKKNRLVPFTESFPFRKQAPWMYQWLLDADTHFWAPGTTQPLLTVGGVRVGTPICFEDAFPDGPRHMAREGAQALVNLTNDAWSWGVASRYQHLSLAVFRAVENRLPLVISANDGATAAISALGRLKAMLPVGKAGVLTATVSLRKGLAPLSVEWGDAPVQIFSVSGLVIFSCLLIAGERKRRRLIGTIGR